MILIGVTSYRLQENDRLLELTKRCLNSLMRQRASFPFEIMLSDQRSSYEVLLRLCKEFKEGVIIVSEEENSVSRSWNEICETAFEVKGYPYALILNNDIEVISDNLDPVVDFSALYPGKIITAQGCFDFSAFLIKRDIYGAVGPFDENLKGGSLEDWDYTERLKERGMGTLPCPQFRVKHEKCATKDFVANDPEILKLRERSKEYYRKKWGDGRHKLP